MRVSAGVTAALAVAVAIGAGAAAAAQSSSGTTARSVKDGVYTTEQAARGRSVYAAHCAECHMPDLAGHEYAGALAGYGFQLKWQDAPLGELLGRIRSMPLGRPGSLGSQDYVDILAYVLQKNSYRAGTTELSASVVSKWPPLRIERVLHAPDGAP